jgi:hypothetical protein
MIGSEMIETNIIMMMAMMAMIVNLEIKLSTVSITEEIKFIPNSNASVLN